MIPMINEAIFTLSEGVASKEDIDAVAKLGFNHPMGPLALSDLIGNDTVLAIMEVLYKASAIPNTVRLLCCGKWWKRLSGPQDRQRFLRLQQII